MNRGFTGVSRNFCYNARVFFRLFHERLGRPVLVTGVCLSLFTGVFVARRFQAVDIFLFWVLIPLLIVSLKRHGIVALVLLCVFFFGIGWWRGGMYMRKLATNEVFYHQKVTVIGHATEDAVYGARYQLEFTMNNVEVISPAQAPLVGNLTVRGFGEPAVYRGDTVRVTGKLFPTLGNNIGSISFAELDVLTRGTSWIDAFRRRFAAGMQSALPEPLASFALGLLIGQRSTLPDDISTQLRHVGLTHIIAVSGYNLTIIVLASRRVFAKRSKFQTMTVCLGLIALFLLITGFSPPIVRASVISLLGLTAWYYGRDIKALVLLLVGAAITVLANPLYLWGNVSWYLSFLAFFGVLVMAPLVTKRLFGAREVSLLVSILIESACASIMVLPYALYIFGETSLMSLPANMLVIPFIPFAMLLSTVAGLGGLAFAAITGWVAWPAKILLTYILDVAGLLSRVPYAYTEDISFSWQVMMLAYLLLGSIVLVLSRRVRRLLFVPKQCHKGGAK